MTPLVICLHIAIEYTDRHRPQIPRANSRTILLLVHRLVYSIHNAALAYYTDRHNSVIAAKGSTLYQRIFGTPYPFSTWIQHVLYHGRPHIGVLQQHLRCAEIEIVKTVLPTSGARFYSPSRRRNR